MIRGEMDRQPYTLRRTSYTDITTGVLNPFGQATKVTHWVGLNTSGQSIYTTETYSYDSHGFLHSSVDANGYLNDLAGTPNNPTAHTTNYTVDILGRTTQILEPAPTTGGTRPSLTTLYDVLGDVQLSSDADGRTTSVTYDKNQRVVQSRNNTDGSVLTNVYDPAGNLFATSDGDGHATVTIYDERDRPVDTVTADGSFTVSDFNGAGLIVSQVDALGNATQNSYNDRGQLISTQEADPDGPTGPLAGRVWKYQVDLAGNRITESVFINGNLVTADQLTQYFYDSLHRLRKQIDPAPGVANEATPVHAFTYDAVGNLFTVTTAALDGSGQSEETVNVYDGLNRRTSSSQFDVTQGGKLVASTQYTYDNGGNLKTITDPRSTPANPIVTTYNYDNLNHLLEEIDPNPNPNPTTNEFQPDIFYTFDNVGNLKVRTVHNAGSSGTSTQTTTYDYDGMNRVLDEKQYDFNVTTGTPLAVTSYAYDSVGNLIKTTDPRGSSAYNEYDVRNRQVRSINELGAASSIIYDADGNAVKDIDAANNTTLHFYDHLNREIFTVDPAPMTANYVVAINASLTSLTYTMGGSSPTASDASPVHAYFYNGGGDKVTTQLATLATIGTGGISGKKQTDFTYDKLHRVVKTLEPPDNTPINPVRAEIDDSYDIYNDRVSETSPYNPATGKTASTSYVYDALNRLIQSTESDASHVLKDRINVSVYDADGNLIMSELDGTIGITLLALSHTEYKYDNLNRQIAVLEYATNTAPGNQPQSQPFLLQSGTPVSPYSVTTTRYDVNGNVLDSIDGSGRDTESSYTALNQLLQQTTSGQVAGNIDVQVTPSMNQGTTTSYSYDADGNLASSTVVFPSKNETTTYQYDRLNRRTLVTDPMGDSTATSYNALSNVASTADGLGKVTTYGYDHLNRNTSIAQPAVLVNGTLTAPTTLMEYDAAGNVTKTTDPNGQFTISGFDDRGQKVSEVRSDVGTPEAFGYDDRGNLVSQTDYMPVTTSFSYDNFNRNNTQTWTNSDGSEEVVLMTYDPDNQMTRYADNRTATTNLPSGGVTVISNYSYNADPLRRLATETDTITTDSNPGGVSTTQTYSYDTGNDVTQDAVSDGSTFTPYSDYYGYDGVGRLLEQRQSGTGTHDIEATFAWDPASELTQVQGSASGIIAYNSFTYDDAGRMATMGHLVNVFQDSYNYTFNAANQMSVRTYLPGIGSAAATDRFTYDNDGQLTSKTRDNQPSANESYTYDDAGNRANTTGIQEELTNDGTFTYTYDKNGNLTKRVRNTVQFGSPDREVDYTWDARNRLIGVTTFFAISGSQTFRYAYDAANHRVATLSTSDLQEDFVYQGDKVLLTRNGAGAVTHRYFNGPLADQVLADDKLTTTGGPAEVEWLLADEQNTVRRVVGSSGSLVANFDFDSYGNVQSTSNPAAVDELFGYSGMQYDSSARLDYDQARWYDPISGRFLSRDPANADLQNPYRYVGNDPTSLTDPTGLEAFMNAYSSGAAEDALFALRGSSGTSNSALPASYSSDGTYGFSRIPMNSVECRRLLTVKGTHPLTSIQQTFRRRRSRHRRLRAERVTLCMVPNPDR